MTALSLSLSISRDREQKLSVAGLDAVPTLNWGLVIVIGALISVGVIMVASASIGFSESNYGDPWFFLRRHITYLLLGGVGGIFIASIPVNIWRQHAWLLLIIAIALLLVVLIPGMGKRVNGSQRWLALGPITVQASEVAKFCMVIFFSSYLSRRQADLRKNWRGVIKPILIIGFIVFLLLLEPDFGGSVVLSAMAIAMLFIAGVKLWQFGLLVFMSGGGLAAVAIISPYRLQRLITFLDPWADQFNSGYQLTQSLIAFGGGGWFGVGLGNSVQKLFYLPEAHTDFIFAIIAEEFGLLGCMLVVGLFVALVIKIFAIARRAIQSDEHFIGFTAFGIGILLAAQAIINVGVASGLLPTKGLTLPFISYGGSSLVVCCGLMALLLRLDWELSVIAIKKSERSGKRDSRSIKHARGSSKQSQRTGKKSKRGGVA